MSLTASNNDKMVRTARGQFFTTLEATTTGFSMSRWITVQDTTNRKEDYAWLGAVPMPTEWVSRQTEERLKEYDHTISVRKWSSRLSFDQDLWDDDKTGTVKNRAASMAIRARKHINKYATQVLEAGLGSTLGTAYDGEPLFSDTHSESGTAQDNNLTKNIVTANAPTVAEFESSADEIIQTISGFTDDQGEPFDDSILENLTFMVPNNMRNVAQKVFGVGGKNSAFGAGMIQEGDVQGGTGQFRGYEAVVNPYLTNDERIYALLPGVPGSVAPLVLLNRMDWQFNVWTRFNSKECDDDDKIAYTGKARYGLGIGAWQAAVVMVFT